MTDLDALIEQLPEIGDGLAAAFCTLHADPLPDRCEILAIRLQGVAQHLLRLGECLRGQSHH